MLDALRGKKAKKVTAWVLVILVGIPFIFYFGWTPVRPEGGIVSQPLVEVGDDVVYNTELHALRLDFGLDMNPEYFLSLDAEQLESTLPDEVVVQQAIDSMVMAEFAQTNGYGLGNQARVEALRSLVLARAGLAPNAPIPSEALQNLVGGLMRMYGLSSVEALQALASRRALRSRTALLEVYPQARTSILELWQEFEEQNTTYTLNCAVFRVGSYLASIEITDDEIQEHYEANLDQYTTGPRRVYEHITVARADVADQLAVTDEEVSEEYRANINSYTTPAIFDLSWILFDGGENSTEPPADAIEVTDLLAQRESFDSLAREFSKDELTRTNGGEYGRSDLTTVESAVAETLRPLTAGQHTEPIQLSNGRHWAIYRVNDIEPEFVRPFSDVRASIRSRLQRQRQEQVFDEISDEFNSVLSEHTDFAEMATELALEAQRTEPVAPEAASIPGIGILDAHGREQLSLLLVGGIAPEAVRTDNAVSLVRLSEEMERSVRPLDDQLQSEIRRRLRQIRAEEMAEEQAYRLRQAALDSPDKTAEDYFTEAAALSAIEGEIQFEEIHPSAFRPQSDVIPEIGQVPGLARSLYYSQEGYLSDVLAVRGVGASQAAGHVLFLMRERIEPDRAEFYGNIQNLRATVLAENQDRLTREWITDAARAMQGQIRRHDL
jgi:hypothetical protein